VTAVAGAASLAVALGADPIAFRLRADGAGRKAGVGRDEAWRPRTQPRAGDVIARALAALDLAADLGTDAARERKTGKGLQRLHAGTVRLAVVEALAGLADRGGAAARMRAAIGRKVALGARVGVERERIGRSVGVAVDELQLALGIGLATLDAGALVEVAGVEAAFAAALVRLRFALLAAGHHRIALEADLDANAATAAALMRDRCERVARGEALGIVWSRGHGCAHAAGECAREHFLAGWQSARGVAEVDFHVAKQAATAIARAFAWVAETRAARLTAVRDGTVADVRPGVDAAIGEAVARPAPHKQRRQRRNQQPVLRSHARQLLP